MLNNVFKSLSGRKGEIHIQFEWNGRRYDIEIYEMMGDLYMILTEDGLSDYIEGKEVSDHWVIKSENGDIFKGSNPVDASITYLEWR